ncbi:MAG: hypothetical protein GX956_00125 [Firmicutes bacterium]|nr:hypothetical protein [Bacillota bacterium]
MSKKKIVYSLMVVLMLNLVGPVVASAKVTDVPTDHWAYYAVNNAINKGYLTVFEDGKFKGSDPVDRFTLATVINLLLEQMEVAQVKGTTGDLNLIRELSLGFEKDLANWYASEKALRDDLQQTKQNALIAEDRVSRVVSAQVNMEESIEHLEEQIKTLQTSIVEVQLGVSDVRGDIGNQVGENEQRLQELLVAVVQIDKELNEQKEALAAQEKAIHGLENWAGEKGAVFATLQLNNESLSNEVKNLKQRNQELENDIRTLAITVRQNNVELAAELDKTREELHLAQAGLSSLQDDLKKQVGADVNAQINAALIREQRLEKQIKEIEAEFASYRVDAEKSVKSAKTLATVAMALAAIGAVIGFVK